MIVIEKMRQSLCRTYPGLRERIVANADKWIGDNGEFVAHAWMGELCKLVRERFDVGDYDQSEALFLLVEDLLGNGDDEVSMVVATGFLEGLQHQPGFDTKYWLPLLGPLSQAHCATVDRFHGIGK